MFTCSLTFLNILTAVSHASLALLGFFLFLESLVSFGFGYGFGVGVALHK